MEYVSLSISELEKEKIISFYKDNQIDVKADYLTFAAEDNNTKIYIYESKKGIKVSYQGENALYEARILFPDAKLNEKKEKIKTVFLDYSSQIGSDEVGTGDLFGPLVVTACYFDEELVKIIPFKIDDSKKLSDKFIINNIPSILPYLKLSKFTLMPEKYNALIEKGHTMNSIKAILHNLALISLSKKINYKNIYVDQFCEEKKYYKYLKKEENVINNIIFTTKGESHYPSIALASMISRYSFLLSFEELNKKYDFVFPKGAGINADEALKLFVEKYGKEELNKVVKMNFKNLKNLEK